MAVSALLLLDHIRYDDIEDLSMWTTLLSVFHQYAHETAQLTQAIVNAGVDFAEYEYMPHNRQWYHNWHAQGSEAGDEREMDDNTDETPPTNAAEIAEGQSEVNGENESEVEEIPAAVFMQVARRGRRSHR